MPVPRLFEAGAQQREQWAHVVASLLALTGPETRSALLAEIVGDVVEGAGGAQVAERRPFTSPAPVVADIVVRSGSSWGVAVHVDLGFDVDRTGTWTAVYDALAAAVDTAILVAVTPDRRPPADVVAAADGRDIRHRSWLRVRDWVQERPERGNAQGVDLLLLREAEYFLTPRVAELYRLESLMPLVRPEVRGALAGLFFDLNDIAPQPTVLNPSDASAVVNFPRTGEPAVTIGVGGGDPVLTIRGGAAGPGLEPADGGQRLTLGSADAYLGARAWIQASAREVLPARR